MSDHKYPVPPECPEHRGLSVMVQHRAARHEACNKMLCDLFKYSDGRGLSVVVRYWAARHPTCNLRLCDHFKCPNFKQLLKSEGLGPARGFPAEIEGSVSETPNNALALNPFAGICSCPKTRYSNSVQERRQALVIYQGLALSILYDRP